MSIVPCPAYRRTGMNGMHPGGRWAHKPYLAFDFFRSIQAYYLRGTSFPSRFLRDTTSFINMLNYLTTHLDDLTRATAMGVELVAQVWPNPLGAAWEYARM